MSIVASSGVNHPDGRLARDMEDTSISDMRIQEDGRVAADDADGLSVQG